MTRAPAHPPVPGAPAPRRPAAARLGLAALAGLLAGGPAAAADRFVVYYSGEAPAAALAAYRWAVLDAEHHPDLRAVAAAGTVTFGYLAAAEAERGRPWHAEAEAAGVLLEENPSWPGSRYADVRRPEWRALVLDRMLPALLARGFAGLFLDTLDDAGFLEQRDPVRFAGMVAAAAELVREIRRRHPGLPIMLNRAYELHALVAADIDAVLAESVRGGYDFAARRYRPQSDSDVRWQIDRLAALRAANPKVRVFTLDYWDPGDAAGVRRLYAAQRRAGFVPYVATIDLHRIVPEPRP